MRTLFRGDARRHLIPTITIAALVAAALTGLGTTAAEAASKAPAIPATTKVAGAHAKARAALATPASSTNQKVTTASLPSGSFSGKLSADAAKLGSSGVSVSAGSSDASGAGVQATLLSADQAATYGLHGLVVRINRTDGGAAAAPVSVSVPASVLDRLYGADYASRVRWVQVTPATITSPKSEGKAAAADETVTSTPASAKALTATTAFGATKVAAAATSAVTLLAAAGSPVSSTGTGSFAATPLSSASTWDVSAQTGDFSWSYALRTPPAAAGPSPSLAFNYDSQSIDGETASSNNQPSAIGDGWSMSGGGFIERSYVPCSQDTVAVASSGDECWKTDNATISFGGHSGLLVKDSSTGTWRLQSDDGSKVEHLVGTGAGCAANGTYDTDCWRVTTTDGTQYWFGLNQLPGWSSGKATTNSAWTVPVFGNDAGEPCHAATFAASSCAQAWRWNLDYIVDVHGNAESLYYNAETNSYAVNGTTTTSYTRGGQLDHIDYGFTTGNAYAANAASDRVSFAYAAKGRCSDSSGTNCTTEPTSGPATTPASASYYPDVPFDQNCASACTSFVSPTFWTTAMLTGVTTSVLKAGSYQQVDAWTLAHSFPDPGDGTKAALWLTTIGHTGTAGGSIAEPNTVFSGGTMQNRVWVKDGLAPLDKYRVTSIQTSTGAVISVNYSAQQCTAANAATIEANLATNTNRCFPQWWTPQVAYPASPQLDLFHKYVVTSLVSNPYTGGGNDLAEETDYVYTGTPAWRYDTSPLTPDAKRTWSGYAGYNTIEIRQGAASVPTQQVATDYTFYQGMDGDRATSGTKTVYVTGSTTLKDSLWFAGTTREVKTLTAVGGTTLTDTVTTPWASNVTANNGTNQAYIVQTADTKATATTAAGGTRTTETANTFNATTGLQLTSNATASDAPTICTTTSYTPTNTTVGLVGLVSEVAKVAADCSALGSAVYPGAAISDVRTSYDSLAWGSTPTKGDATQTQTVKAYTGTTAATATWITASQTAYDSMGRVTSLTDTLGHTATTAYTPAAGAAAGSGPMTSVTSTNTLGWASTTTVDPAWGVEMSVVDPNGSTTTATYDALGRRTAVWYPDNPQSASPTQPNLAYKYTLSQTAANIVETDTLTSSLIVPEYDLYDGLGRLVQSQTLSEGTGSMITDNWYDSLGRTWVVNNTYWAAATPSGTQFVPATESQIPSEVQTNYDSAGRTTASILISGGTERYPTTTSYPGIDRVDTVPPSGGVPTSVYTNSRGLKTSLVQYLSASISGTTETTNYSYNAAGSMTGMTDAAGNSWSWAFDVLGRQTSATDPDTGTTTSSYDNGGNLTSTTDARGVTLTYGYDALNRKTSQSQQVTGGQALLASWTYDTVKKGQLTSSSSYVGSTASANGIAYTSSIGGYDAQYNPTSSTVSIPTGAAAFAGTSYTTSYAYNTDGSLSSVGYPAMGGLAAESVTYGYTTTGLLGSLSSRLAAYDTVSYTPLGQVGQDMTLRAQNVYESYGYDHATGALLSIADLNIPGSTSTNLQTTNYSYDNAGNLTQATTTSASAASDTQCFKYDQLANLSQAFTPSSGSCAAAPTAAGLGGPAPYWVDYSVSPASGNRLSTVSHSTSGTTTTATYSYPASGSAHPHAVSQVATTGGSTSTTSYGYDADGDTTTRGAGTVTWNAIGKAATVVQGTTTQGDVYDASGALLLQTDTTAGATLFLGATELHIAAGSTTTTAVRTYSRGSTPIAERSTASGSNVLTWLLADRQGTVTGQLVDSTGTYTARRQDPYGLARTGSSAVWGDGHAFLNATASAVTGLTQLGARLYDATIGRFTSVDPVLSPYNPDQNDGYSYGANSPLVNSDPSGDCYYAREDALSTSTACAGGNSVFSDSADTITNWKSAGNPTIGTVAPKGPSWSNGSSRSHVATPSSKSSAVSWGYATSSMPACGQDYDPCLTAKQIANLPHPTAQQQGVALIILGVLILVAGTAISVACGPGEPACEAGVVAGGTAVVGSATAAEAGSGEAGAAEAAGHAVNAVGGTMNCVNCAIAGDATLGGAPASALDSAPQSISKLEEEFGSSFESVDGKSEIEQIMSAAGPGSKGIVFGSRGPGAIGHVFNVVNQGGVVRFIDFQTGRGASFSGYSSFLFLRTNG